MSKQVKVDVKSALSKKLRDPYLSLLHDGSYAIQPTYAVKHYERNQHGKKTKG